MFTVPIRLFQANICHHILRNPGVVYFQQLTLVSADRQLSHPYLWVGHGDQVWMSGRISLQKRDCYFVPLHVFGCPFPFSSYYVFVLFSLEESSYVAEKMLNDL